MEMKKSKPIAVIISDVHYNIQTLEVADKAMRMAVDKANILDVPLVITGDLHDTKANIRAECARAIDHTLSWCKHPPFLLRGNHDSMNEKSEINALGFLKGVIIINVPIKSTISVKEWYFIPYQHTAELFKEALNKLNPPSGAIIFCHQGVIGSSAGHYFKDNSAVPLEWFKDYRVISGHYHTRQTLWAHNNETWDKGYTGMFDYVGNPYTLGFGEANDPKKGFQVLYNDGSLEFVPTNLRRHKILELDIRTDWLTDVQYDKVVHPTDILWVKVTGPSDLLTKYPKEKIAKLCNITQDFRLDLIPLDNTPEQRLEYKAELTQTDTLDSIIDALKNTDDKRKLRLKGLWKTLV